MSGARASCCAVLVTADMLTIATDVDPTQRETVALDQDGSLQEQIMQAVNSRVVDGGYAALIDTDNQAGLTVSEPGAIALISPTVISGQCQVRTAVVTPHQALAAMVRGTMFDPIDICPTRLSVPISAFRLWQIEAVDGGYAVSYCLTNRD